MEELIDGGCYTDVGSSYPASCRSNDYPNGSYENCCGRPTLYIR